jgi:Tat protein secretion system quality control protein TatD with DNase activity
MFPDVPRFTDFRKMFDALGRGIDAVSVAVPDFSHFPIAMLAMAQGKHVYCEKPLAHSVVECRELEALAAAHPEVHAAVGIHPTSVHEIPEDGWLERLRALALQPRVVALGEMGLDYYHPPQDGSPVEAWRARQARVFAAQLDLAEELDLPVIIHQRESAPDVLAMVRNRADRLRAVFHCFTGTLEEAQELCGRIAMLKAGRVVALERTADLLGRFGGGAVTLRLSGAPLPPALRPLLQGEPATDGRIALRLEDWQRLEPILATLREAGCRIEEMELAHTDLEDVFLRIMAEPGFQPALPAAGEAGAACLRRTGARENVNPPGGGTST